MQYRSLRLAAATVAAGLFLAFAAPSRAGITRTPYIQNVQTTSAVVMWESDQATPGVVHYGLDEKMERSTTATEANLMPPKPAEGAPKPKSSIPVLDPPANVHVYEAALEGLAPGATVYYQVEDGGVKSEPHQFKAKPESAEKFRFAAYGDNRTQTKVHAAVAEQIRLADPAFIIHTGDLVTNGRSYKLWTPEFFQPMERVLDHIPLWPSIGNHEGDGFNYTALFHLPEGETYYSFDYGTAHFAALDCVGQKPGVMAEWLDKDLSASKARWKFVYYHFPSYNAGGHNSDWGRDVLTPIYRKHHVDVVFAGHSHLYERSKPIFSSYDEVKWPVLYMVTGGGGAPLYDVGEGDYIAVAIKSYHALVVDVDGDKFSVKAVDEKGATIDEYSFDKTGGPSADYLGSAISEELTNFTDALRHRLLKQAPDGAKAGEPFEKTYKISNPEIRGQAKLKITPQASPFFSAIEPASLEFALDQGAEKEATFKFTPAATFDAKDPAFAELLKGADAERKWSKPFAPLLTIKAEYDTPLGKGTLDIQTMTFGLGKGFKAKD